jgi:hypothetical protein
VVVDSALASPSVNVTRHAPGGIELFARESRRSFESTDFANARNKKVLS